MLTVFGAVVALLCIALWGGVYLGLRAEARRAESHWRRTKE